MSEPTIGQLWLQAAALSEPVDQLDTLVGAIAADRAWAAARRHPLWSALPMIQHIEALMSHAFATLGVAAHGGPLAAAEAAREHLQAAIALRPDHYGLRAMLAASAKGGSPAGVFVEWRALRHAHPGVTMDDEKTHARLDQL